MLARHSVIGGVETARGVGVVEGRLAGLQVGPRAQLLVGEVSDSVLPDDREGCLAQAGALEACGVTGRVSLLKAVGHPTLAVC